MRIRSLFTTVACLAMTGTTSCLCGTPPADVVGVNAGQTRLYVGEKTKVTGWAESLGEYCGGPLEDSDKDPGAYIFSNSDPSVASMTSRGEVTAVGIGSTTITVTRGSRTSSVEIVVTKPIAEIRITATPATPAVGDTVKAITEAIDFSGQVVPGVIFTGFYVDAIPAPGGTNPVVLGGATSNDHIRFVIKSPGRYILRNTFVHTTSGLSARLELDVP